MYQPFTACTLKLLRQLDLHVLLSIRSRPYLVCSLKAGACSLISLSPLPAGFLARNWGGRKRERIRQQGPLLYTPGALTWNVSIILRGNKVWRQRGGGRGERGGEGRGKGGGRGEGEGEGRGEWVSGEGA